MQKNRYLIVGGSSNIGNHLIDYFKKKKITFYYTTRKKKNKDNNHYYLDITKKISKKILNLDFDILIYCIGITSIEVCRNNKSFSRNINVIMAKSFLNKFKNKKIIYFSSIKNRHFLKEEYFKQKKNLENFLIKNFKSKYIILKLGKLIFDDIYLFNKWKEQIQKGKKITVYKNTFYYETKISKLLSFFRKKKCRFNSKVYKLFSSQKKSYTQLAKYFLKKKKMPLNFINFVN